MIAPRWTGIHRTFLALAVTAALAGCGSSGDGDASNDENPSGAGSEVVFPAPADASGAAEAAGLEPLPQEQLEYHIHPQLTVYVDGDQVKVPANIGIDQEDGLISALHTHDDSGEIHVEAPERADFTLGQLFTEWDVELTDTCIADHCPDEANGFVVYVDGEPVDGDPNDIVFEDEQEIIVWHGPKDVKPTVPE